MSPGEGKAEKTPKNQDFEETHAQEAPLGTGPENCERCEGLKT